MTRLSAEIVGQGKTLESVSTFYSPATWRDHEGGYVGSATWRDEYGMATTSYCGHRHRHEEKARVCIEAWLTTGEQGEQS